MEQRQGRVSHVANLFSFLTGRPDICLCAGACCQALNDATGAHALLVAEKASMAAQMQAASKSLEESLAAEKARAAAAADASGQSLDAQKAQHDAEVERLRQEAQQAVAAKDQELADIRTR